MARNPLDGFVVDKSTLATIGSELQRPECILAEADGTLWSADARGGVVRIAPDGSQKVITQSHTSAFSSASDDATRFVEGTLPNGLAFAGNGDIIISNFGTDCLERMTRDGKTELLFDSFEGKPIGKVNFVARDSRDRLWITVSTMIHDWPSAISPNVVDGRVLLYDRGEVRLVADGIHFANECKLDAKEEHLYVVQTCGRNVLRFRIEDDGSLRDRKVFGPEDHGTFLDGIAFDAHGNLWGTHVMTDRLFAITPEGELRILLDDTSPEEIEKVDRAFQRDEATTELLLSCGGAVAPWMASITFGGPDLRTVYVGSLRGTTIPYFRSPVPGLPLVHWSRS
jgi:sugar lactone lactonase YvrE